MSVVVLRGLRCAYKNVVAVENFDLDIKSGEFVTLLGPSGSGKTSVLRSVGGYILPTSGSISIDGRDITRVPPQGRNIGMVFQNYALFPHMRVFDNIAFGLRVRRLGKDEIAKRVREAVGMMHLGGLEDRYPHELSGGQQQRVALARAIAIRPSVLLMDEPLGALDVRLREALQLEIRRVQRALGITTIYVTHDQSEAFTMSDRIVVMHLGKIMSVGSPEDLFYRPSTRFTAQFVANANLLEVDVVRWNGQVGTVKLRGSDTAFEVHGDAPSGVGATYLAVRPEDVLCSREPEPGSLPGKVVARRFTGFTVLLSVLVGDRELTVLDPAHHWSEGDDLYVRWDPDRVELFQEPADA